MIKKDNNDIIKAFPEGFEFREVVFKPTISNGDIVRLKTIPPHNAKFGRKGFYSTTNSESKWKVSKVYVQLNEDGTQTTMIGWLDEICDNGHFGGWIEDSYADDWEIIERKEEPKEQLCYIPYDFGDIIWHFPNHLYDTFSPDRSRVVGYRYCVGCPIIILGMEEWHYNPYSSHYTDWDFYGRINYYTPIGKTYYPDYRTDEDGDLLVKEYYPCYYSIPFIKSIFEDETNFVKFAKQTWLKDSFGNSQFEKPNYEQLMKDLGKTMDDLIKASQSDVKPKVKKRSTTKKVTNKTQKKSKVSEMLSGMSSKDKKELLKLLQNEQG